MAGPKAFAQELKTKIAKFLNEELKLELSQEKTLITNAAKGKAFFLGTEIQRISSVNGEIKRYKNSRGHPQRIPTSAVVMNAPIARIVDRLVKRGVANWTSNKLKEDNLNPQPILK